MAPPKAASHRPAVRRRKSGTLVDSILDKYLNVRFFKYLLLEPAALPIVGLFVLLAEAVINVVVIQRVPYTEIDWVAYMQECEGFLNGTTNYALLRGEIPFPFLTFHVYFWRQVTPFLGPFPAPALVFFDRRSCTDLTYKIKNIFTQYSEMITLL